MGQTPMEYIVSEQHIAETVKILQKKKISEYETLGELEMDLRVLRGFSGNHNIGISQEEKLKSEIIELEKKVK
jgi:hypothetical protein